MDVQNQRPQRNFKLTRVGVTGVKKPIQVKRPGKDVVLTSRVDVFVDLPSSQKGSHMSRNLEVINEILDRSVREPQTSIERLAIDIAEEILARHEYATRAEVCIEGDYFLERTRGEGQKSFESYKILGRSIKPKDGPSKKTLGVEVVGMTSCPCAMEAVREGLIKDHQEQKGFLEKIPVATHNQRNITTVLIECPESAPEVEADHVIDIVESSQSAPTFEVLKRADEGALVLDSHSNPKFVEDVVRDVLGKLLERYPDMPDETMITVRSESEESIHKHNAFAERRATVGELRE